ncbi:MAG: anti-sigma factor, partial [Thermus sp.]
MKRWPSLLGQAAALGALFLAGYGFLWSEGWLWALSRPGTEVFALERPEGGVVGRVILRPDRTALVLL